MQTLHIKSPMEKIIMKLIQIEKIGDLDLREPIRMVQKFAEELEHEKASCISNILIATRWDQVKFEQGRMYQIKRLQRDFQRE